MLKNNGVQSVLFALLLLMASTYSAALEKVAERGDIAKYRLANGLKIILAPDASGDAVFFNLIYQVGSLDDPEGKSGTAHLLEHLMFRGTEQRSGEALTQELSQRGIQFNATTSYDRTRYTAILDSDTEKLDFLLALEAERMTQLQFQQEILDAEREVVFREMELALDQPVAALGQAIMSAASPHHGLGRPVLGTKDEVKAITLSDLDDFYARHYHPDQAVMVLTGNFDRKQALAQIQKHFAGITAPANRVPKSPLPSFTLNTTANVQVKAGDVDWIAAAYPLPEAENPANVALAALADIMAGVPHGRLYKTLVESGTAHGVMGLQLSFRHAGYYIFSAPIVSGHSADESLKQMTQALENLAENPLQADELERFQATVAAQKWQLLQNPGLLADVLSESAALGNWQLILDRFENFADLNLADVQQQAETLLNSNQRITGRLLATPISDRLTDASGVSSAHLATLKTIDDKSALMNNPATAVPEFDLLAFNQQIETIEASLDRYKLTNGLQVILRAQPGSGKPVQGRMAFRFGDEYTLMGKRALAELTGTLILRGTETTSFQALVDQVNSMGAGLFIEPTTGTVAIRLETPPNNLESILMLIQEILQQPAFTLRDFDVVKRQQQQALRQTNQQPAQVANRAYQRHVERYPLGHLLRHRDNNEILAELEPLTLDDVKAFHRQFYGTNHGQLALSGDFDPETIKPILQQLFGQWNSPAPFSRKVELYEPFTEARLHVHANAFLTGHYLAYLHFSANNDDKDAAALLLAERVLGRHPSESRLSKRFRQDKGLTYGIRTSNKIANFGTDSWFKIESSYPITQGNKFADLVREEVKNLIEYGITDEELSQAKQSIFQERQLALSQDHIVVAQLPSQTYRGQTYLDWINRNQEFASLTRDQVNTAIRKHLNDAIWIEVLADRSGKKE